MKNKLIGAFVIFGICIGLISGPSLAAQEEQGEIGVIEHETIDVEGDNYGYIPAGGRVPISADEMGTINNSNGMNGSGNLPASYDSRAYGYVTSVKDQGYYGTCWAFAAISSAESDAIIDGRKANPDYSEAQLAWFTYNRVTDPLGNLGNDGIEFIDPSDTYLDIGGNSYISTMSLASWIAPADESTMDYDDVPLKYADTTSVDPSYGYEACVAHLQDAYWISMSDTESIKKMIMQYGSIDSSLYYNDEYLEYVPELQKTLFYNPDYPAQNHEISLVGWDDNLSKSYFTKTIDGETYTPQENGAWLVKNSYGDYFHDDGYFWISYYDEGLNYIYDWYNDEYYVNIATAYNFESVDNYDYNYQYDGGYTTYEAYTPYYSDSVYSANVFTVQNSAQQIEAVSFYTTMTNMEYSIQIYKVTKDGTPMGTPLLSKPIEGLEPYSGYHTVEINEKIVLNEGDRFSVVVRNTITTDDYYGVGATAFYDASTSDSYFNYISDNKAGQSYLSFDGVFWDDMHEERGANVRVKAFANYRPIEAVNITGDSYRIGVGETISLTAKITPSNATETSLKWSSSNSNVAKVDSSGKVTGVGKGTATISVTSPDGTKKDTCIVNVYKTVTGVTVSPSSVLLVVGEEETAKLTANVVPSDAEDTTVSWSSSNTKVATVDGNGMVTAVAPGQANITVTSNVGGKKATCTVKVYETYEKPNPPQLESKTSNSVTLVKNAGYEYSKDNKNWTSNNVFTGLEEDTTYTFYVRRASGGFYLYSPASDGLEVTTNVFVEPNIKVSYRTHIQTFGWEGNAKDINTWKADGAMSGTSGKAKRLEGINIVVNPTTACEDLDLGIQYTTHCQSYGWLPWSADGDMNGTEGEAKRLEAIMIKLTGEHAQYYDVYYRVHAQTYGWLGWAKNGEPSGTAGYAKRLEGIQIVVVKKGESFNQNIGNIASGRTDAFVAKAGSSPIVNCPATSNTAPVVPGEDMVNVAYRTHVQSFGWQGWKYNGAMSGTSGKAKRLEGIEIKLTNKDYEGGIAYCTHVQKYAWQGADLNDPTTWKQDGEMAGTSGEAKRLEAICITLTGEMAEHYDIYYRVHAQSFGWLGWAKNGEASGTAGYAKRLEGIQIVLVEKGKPAPADDYMGINSVKFMPYIEK